MRCFAAVAAVLLIGTALPAVAQDYSPLAEYGTALGMAVSQSHAISDTFRDVYGPGGRYGPGTRAEGVVRPAPSAPAAHTTFAASPNLRRAHIAAFLDRVRKADPRNAPAFEQGFARQDLFAVWGRELAPFGLNLGDLADVYAAYWIVAWQAAHGQDAPPSRTQAQAVRSQSARAFAALPVFAHASDAARQEFADELILQSLVIESQSKRTLAHPEEKAVLARYARASARRNGIDLDTMRLTGNGFVAS